MSTKLLLVPAAVAMVAVGAAAATQADLGGPAPAGAPPSTLEVPTALDDWCGFIDVAFGPGGAAPSVAAAVDASLVTGAATPELAYAAQLGGIPPEVESSVALLLVAVEELVADEPVTDPQAVRDAADSVDAFEQSACGA